MKIIIYKNKEYQVKHREQGSYKCYGCEFHNDDDIDTVNTACSIVETVRTSRTLLVDDIEERDMLDVCQYGSKMFAKYATYARKKMKFV